MNSEKTKWKDRNPVIHKGLIYLLKLILWTAALTVALTCGRLIGDCIFGHIDVRVHIVQPGDSPEVSRIPF